MKAAFFHDSIFIKKNDEYYTSGTLNEDLFKFYLKYFESVEIVTRYKSYKNEKLLVSNLVKVKNINFNCALSYKESIKKVKNAIKRCDIAIIRCHSFIGTIAAYYAKKYHKKYIVESVSCAFDCLWYHSLKGKLLAPIMYILTKKVVKKAYAVSYVSEAFLQNRYPNNNICLSCSDVVIHNEKNILENRLKLYSNINTRKIIFGNISNIDMKYKGQKYLLLAARELIKEGYNIEVDFVGNGKGNKLKHLVKKHKMDDYIRFLGPMPHDKIFEFLKKIDVYVQPSIAESHGRVIVEAMSVGCPVIGSNVGGIPELVNHQYVFKKKNYKDLYRKMKNLLVNKNIYESTKYSIQKSSEFNQTILLNKRDKYYRKIIGRLK